MSWKRLGIGLCALGLVLVVMQQEALSQEERGAEARSEVREIPIPDGHGIKVYTLGGECGRRDVVDFAPASMTVRYRVRYEPEHELLNVRVTQGDRSWDYTFLSPLRWDIARQD